MNKLDRVDFATMITGMAEIYGKSLSAPAIAIYYNALEKYPIEKIKIAVNNIVKERVYAKFPVPAEFIEHIEPSGNLEVGALVAVEEVLDMNEIQGGTMSVRFNDPIITHTIIRMGGWVKVAGKIREIAFDNPREMPFWKKDFMKLYSYFAKQPDLLTPPDRLIGSMEADNINRGYADGLRLPSGKIMLIDTGAKENENKQLISNNTRKRKY